MGIREDIDALDSKVARLKVDYEKYFTRVLKREPAKLRDEIERTILNYSSRNITNTAAKFKLNSVVAKYNSYKQYWTRVLRAMEDGTYARSGGAPEAFATQAQEAAPAPASAPGAPRPQAGDDGEVRELYAKYMDARRQCSEPTENVTYESVARAVEKYRKEAEARYNTKDVDIKVYIKDGKARLAMTPRKKAADG